MTLAPAKIGCAIAGILSLGMSSVTLSQGADTAISERLGSHLRDMRAGVGQQDSAGLTRLMRSSMEQARLFITLRINPENVTDEALRREIHSLAGVDLRYLSNDRRWARISISNLDVLDQLSQQPWLSEASFAPPAILRRGEARSRAGVALRSEQLAASYTVDGSGQAIGIISDSFSHTSNVRDANTTPAVGQTGTLMGSRPQDSGDLPQSVRILADGSRDESGNFDGTDEGAAMAELVYDIAPGADILFHTAGGNRREFADAISNLCNGGASIVVDDILFLTESSYQDDLPAIAASNCVAKGIPYVSAVGNDGDQGHRFVYRDSNRLVDEEAGNRNAPTGSDLHNWSQSGTDHFMAVTLPARASTFVLLNWNQPSASVNPSNGAQVDLDLYATTRADISALTTTNASFYARGANTQGTTNNPRGDAVEFLLLETGSTAQTFYLAVEHYAGSQGDIPQQRGVPLEFRLLFSGTSPDSVEYDYNGPSTWGHALTAGIAAVAAVPWWESPEFAPSRYTTPDIDPEPFTSRGGSQTIQFDSQGNYQASNRNPPAFAGVDGNNTTFLGSPSSSAAPEDGEPDGFPNFFGTSAAAPNVAAVFALMLEAFPAATPAQLISAARDSAIDVTGFRAASGNDDVTGPGLLNASAAADLLAQRVGDDDNTDDTPPQDNDGGNTGGGSGGSVGGSSGGGGGGCFIATAAYGSFIAEDVELLRDFRDRVLLQFGLGRQFVAFYYQHSPKLANAIAEREWAKSVVRAGLYPMVLSIRYPLSSAAGLLLMLLALHIRRQKKALIQV